MAQVLCRRGLGMRGLLAADRINKAKYVSQIEDIARNYFCAKVTSKRDIEANRAHLAAKRDALAANVATSCAPYVRRVAGEVIFEVPRLWRNQIEAHKEHNEGPRFGAGDSGGGGAGM